MTDRLTIDDIKNRHDSEWVLVGDPEFGPDAEVLSGVVLWHSRDRDEVYRKAIEMRPSESATLYIGSIPEDSAVIL